DLFSFHFQWPHTCEPFHQQFFSSPSLPTSTDYKLSFTSCLNKMIIFYSCAASAVDWFDKHYEEWKTRPLRITTPFLFIFHSPLLHLSNKHFHIILDWK